MATENILVPLDVSVAQGRRLVSSRLGVSTGTAGLTVGSSSSGSCGGLAPTLAAPFRICCCSWLSVVQTELPAW